MGKHHKHGPATVTVDQHGDVTNMRGTLNDAPLRRPYVEPPKPDQKGK